ncbi:hypothetical protein [Spirosoma sp.]|uniref:hypothetical protein n=1 Tax=Spirosoma sp. TaxID=1899569 RepID=UPI003B3A5962
MKKQFTLSAVLLLLTFCSTNLLAQNEKRYSIEMSFNFNGKTVKTALASASYSINRELYEEDSSYAPKKYIYYSATPIKLEKDLLLAIKDKKASYDILITMTDNYGKEAKKETLLKKAIISSIAESYSPYAYDAAGSIRLGISAASIVLDGVELVP